MTKYSDKPKRAPSRNAGFTLLELMIVMSIIFILLGMAVPQYRRTVQRAREAALHSDLKTMRDAIDNYTLDRLSPPQSLDDLANAKYIREVPADPITHAKDWVLDYGDTVLARDKSGWGFRVVHPAPGAMSLKGTEYNPWKDCPPLFLPPGEKFVSPLLSLWVLSPPVCGPPLPPPRLTSLIR